MMIHRLLFILLWIFFEALSLLNGWGGLVGHVLAPLALAALFAGLVAGITGYAESHEDGDSLHPDS
jgi:membrane associated rhomboid family serine protease